MKTKEPDIVVSFSGGKSSAMMCWLLENHEMYKHRKKHYVFANTGRELTDTLFFMKRWMEDYLEVPFYMIEAVVHPDERKSSTYRIIPKWTQLSIEGEPFEAVIQKYGLPSVAFPHCSRELKVNPIRSFIREHLNLEKGEYVQAIGMRFDEGRRARLHDPEFIYPLFELEINKQDVNDFFEQDYHRGKVYCLGLEEFEGNCDFCFKKSHPKLMRMFKKHLHRMNWWMDMQNKYWKDGANIYRGSKDAQTLIEEGFTEINKETEKDYACTCSFTDHDE